MTNKINLIELLSLFIPREDFSYRVRISNNEIVGFHDEYSLRELVREYIDLVKKGTDINDSIFNFTVNLFYVMPNGTIYILLDFDKHKASKFIRLKHSSLLNLVPVQMPFKISFYDFYCNSLGDLQLNKVLQVSFETPDMERLSRLYRDCRVLSLTVEHNDAKQRYELVFNLLFLLQP